MIYNILTCNYYNTKTPIHAPDMGLLTYAHFPTYSQTRARLELEQAKFPIHRHSQASRLTTYPLSRSIIRMYVCIHSGLILYFGYLCPLAEFHDIPTLTDGFAGSIIPVRVDNILCLRLRTPHTSHTPHPTNGVSYSYVSSPTVARRRSMDGYCAQQNLKKAGVALCMT
jgi:hypothetical protein